MTATPMRVTAHLDTLMIEPTGMFGLDGPLAWGFVERAKAHQHKLPPLTPQFAPDFPLPLSRHDETDPWVWCTSQAHFDPAALVTVNVRRKPATQAMARYSDASKHHVGLGPYKARDMILPGMATPTVHWDILCTDTDELQDLLSYITHLGPRRRNGFGHITSWTIDTIPDPHAWTDRPMPHTDGTRIEQVRAPYWHHTRRAPVAC